MSTRPTSPNSQAGFYSKIHEPTGNFIHRAQSTSFRVEVHHYETADDCWNEATVYHNLGQLAVAQCLVGANLDEIVALLQEVREQLDSGMLYPSQDDSCEEQMNP